MAIVSYPSFLQTQSYSAQKLRYQQEMFTPNGEGVMGQADFRVGQRGAGANMSVDVAAGDAVVRGDTITRQGLYHVTNDAVINAAISANASGNPRIDRVVLTCNDSTDSSSGTDVSTITVIAGTPSGGATLDNLTGAAAVPNNALLLADVVVANGAVSILDASIRSRRSVAKAFLVPTLTGISDIDQVPLLPHPTLQVNTANFAANSFNNFQQAALFYLPRRIVGATKLRWRYLQFTTAMTGNYIFGIYDASGRQIAATASTAFTGGASSTQVRSEALTATTTFEAGMYYVLFGMASLLAGTSIYAPAANGTEATSGLVAASIPGVMLRASTGGVTLPSTVLGLTDQGTTVLTNAPGVPLISLSTT